MPGFDLGAISSRITVNLQSFTQGLRDALAQGKQTTAQLTQALTTKIRVDTTPVQTAVAQTQAAMRPLTEHPPQLDLEFDITEAEQGAFGFMRNLDAIQHQAQETSTQGTRVGRTWLEALRSPLAAVKALGTGLQHLWEGAKSGTASLLQGFKASTQAAQAHGAAAEGAGHRGAAGFLHLGKEVLNTTKGFALAQIGLASLEQALERLKRFFESITEAVAENEELALRFASAMRLSGQDGGKSLAELTEGWDAVEAGAKDAAREVGAQARPFQLLVIQAVQYGQSWQHATDIVKGTMSALRGQFGDSERFLRVQGELVSVLEGKIDSATTLIRLMGRTYVKEVAEAFAAGRVEEGLAKMNAALKRAGDENKAWAGTWRAVTNAASQAFEEIKEGEAGIKFVKALELILQDITKDLQTHGPLWQSVTTAVERTAGAVKTLYEGMQWFARASQFAAAGWDEMLQASIRATGGGVLGYKGTPTEAESLAQARLNQAKADEAERQLAALRAAKGMVPTTPTPGTPPAADAHGGPTGTPTPNANLQLENQKNLLTDITLKQQDQVALTRAQGDQLVANTRLRGSDAEIARASGAAEANGLKAQIAANSAIIAQREAIFKTMSQIKELQGAPETLAFAAETESLKRQNTMLGIQLKTNAITTNTAAVTAELASLDKQREQSAQLLAKTHELDLLTQRQAGGSEITQMQAAHQEEVRGLEAQAAKLQARKAELAAHGMLSDELQKQLDTDLQILGLDKQILQLKQAQAEATAKATQALAMMALADQGRQIALQRTLDLEDSRQELDQIHIRALDLSADKEQMLLTYSQTERQERQINAQLAANAAQAKSEELALQQQLLQEENKGAEAIARLTGAHQNRLAELGNESAKLQEQLTILEAIREEAKRVAELAPFKALAGELVSVIDDFKSSLLEGSLELAKTVRGIGQAFIDYAMKPAFEAMQKSLANLLQSISTKLGSWGGLISAGVGIALVAVGSLFDRQRAEVESLGDDVKKNIESVEKVRGIVAGETSMAIQRISEDLMRALRPTNSILSDILTAIRQQSGQAASPVTATGYGGYSITSEVLAGARL